MGDSAVVILAGGDASRFPGKLEIDDGGMPMLARVYANVRSAGPVCISTRRPASQTVLSLGCSIVYDRLPHRGPLYALMSAFEAIPQSLVLAVAGDAPRFDRSAIAQLFAAWNPGAQAAVPMDRDGRMHPLCALYDRKAFLAEGVGVLESSGAVASVVDRLQTTYVRLHDERALRNVNTPADYAALLRAEVAQPV